MIRSKIRVMAALLALVTAGAGAYVRTLAVAAYADAVDPLAGLDEALQKGDVPGALSLAGAAADSVRTRLAGTPTELATALESLAVLLIQDAGGTAEIAASGEALLRESLELRTRVLGEDHLDVAGSLDLLSTVHYDQGRFDDAEGEERRCLAIRLRHLPANDTTIAQARYGLGAILFKEGRYAEAEDRFMEAIRIAEAEGDGSRPQQARLANNLAGLYKDEGRYDEAETLLRRSLTLRTQAPSPNAGDLALVWLNLAELERLRGGFQDAEPLYVKALAMAAEEDDPPLGRQS